MSSLLPFCKYAFVFICLFVLPTTCSFRDIFRFRFTIPLIPKETPINCVSTRLSHHNYYGTNLVTSTSEVYRHLISCANIKTLSLSFAQGGCVIDDSPRAFTFRAGDSFPDLEELTVSGYDWDPLGLEAWKKAMNWGKLKRLDIDRPPNFFLQALSGNLDGLDTLVLRPKWGFWGDEKTLCGFDPQTDELRENYTLFIAGLSPLRELSVRGMGRLLDMKKILGTHGVTLERLEIHEFERDCAYSTCNVTWTRPSLTVAEIEEIRDNAPLMQSLELDLYRSADRWPILSLNALSLFSNLTNLTINFDLEDPNRRKRVKHCNFRNEEEIWDRYCTINDLMHPLLNETSAYKILRVLRHGQPNTKLQRLTLNAGNVDRRSGGGMRSFAHDEENKVVVYNCWVDQAGEEQCKNQVDDEDMDGTWPEDYLEDLTGDMDVQPER